MIIRRILEWDSCFVSISGEELSELSDNDHGIYIMVGIDGTIEYVGKTEEQSFRERVGQHYEKNEKNGKLIASIINNSPMEIWTAKVDKRIAARIEQYLIDTLNPHCNINDSTKEEPISCNLPDF